VKFSALQLERVPVVVPPIPVNKGKLLMQVRTWGREFLTRMAGHKLTEQVRQQVARFEGLRIPPVEAVVEKLTPAVPETPQQAPVERLTPSVKVAAHKPQPKPHETITRKKRTAARPSVSQKQSPYYAPTVSRPRQGRGMSM
jgi:hypothetical protein